jgi:Uma2 family endonuclease
MVTSPTCNLTLEEFLQLPETKPASEYVDGKIIQKPMPKGKHSRFQGKLVTAINDVFEDKKIGLAFPELRCTFGGRSIVPDVSVFLWERIPTDDDGDIADIFPTYPDWTIEILSPDQNQTKVTSNILHCLDYGSSLGWLIDPSVRSIIVYPPKQQPKIVKDAEEILPVPDFATDLQLTLGELLSWLKKL